MRVSHAVVGIAALLATTASGLCQQTSEMKVIAKEGGWELRQSKDRFSDKPSCMVTFGKLAHIQVTTRAIWISYRHRGGIRGFQYRLDEAPPTQMALATDIQKQMGAIGIEGAAFEPILRAKRLRVQGITILSGLQDDDINLTSLPKLYTAMLKACPGGGS